MWFCVPQESLKGLFVVVEDDCVWHQWNNLGIWACMGMWVCLCGGWVGVSVSSTDDSSNCCTWMMEFPLYGLYRDILEGVKFWSGMTEDQKLIIKKIIEYFLGWACWIFCSGLNSFFDLLSVNYPPHNKRLLILLVLITTPYLTKNIKNPYVRINRFSNVQAIHVNENYVQAIKISWMS